MESKYNSTLDNSFLTLCEKESVPCYSLKKSMPPFLTLIPDQVQKNGHPLGPAKEVAQEQKIQMKEGTKDADGPEDTDVTFKNVFSRSVTRFVMCDQAVYCRHGSKNLN